MTRDLTWYAIVASGIGGALMIFAALPGLMPVWAGLFFFWLLVKFSRRLFGPSGRWRCLACDYRGPMSTVLQTTRGGLLSLLLLLAMLVPGVLYIVWRWNAPVCPRCGAIKQAVIDPE